MACEGPMTDRHGRKCRIELAAIKRHGMMDKFYQKRQTPTKIASVRKPSLKPLFLKGLRWSVFHRRMGLRSSISTDASNVPVGSNMCRARAASARPPVGTNMIPVFGLWPGSGSPKKGMSAGVS
jgi:hypothetical protein